MVRCIFRYSCIWNIPQGKPLVHLAPSDTPVAQCIITQDGKYVFTLNGTGQIKMWHLEDKTDTHRTMEADMEIHLQVWYHNYF